MALPVFFLFLVVEHTQVRCVARLTDALLCHGLQHGATRLVPVGAVPIAAVGRLAEDFGKVVAYFFRLHVEGAETFDARRVDEVAVPVYGVHFREGGGVHAFVVYRRYFARAGVGVGQDGVDEGRLAYARIARKEGDASLELLLQCVNALACEGRYLVAGVADGGVEVYQCVQVAQVVFLIGIRFVEYKVYGDAVGFGRGEETVDEGGRRFGIVDGNYQHALVEVGCQDMRLLGQVRGTADDVVLAVFYLADEGGACGVENDVHAVAHGYGIGAAYAFQAEITFYLALYALSLVGLDKVPAAGVFDYEALQNS